MEINFSEMRNRILPEGLPSLSPKDYSTPSKRYLLYSNNDNNYF